MAAVPETKGESYIARSGLDDDADVPMFPYILILSESEAQQHWRMSGSPKGEACEKGGLEVFRHNEKQTFKAHTM